MSDLKRNDIDMTVLSQPPSSLRDEAAWCEDQLIEQHYRQLLDHSPTMTLVHESGRIVYMNPSGVKLLAGTSEEQFIGRRVTEIVQVDSIPEMLARIASLRCVGDASGPAPETLLRMDGTTLDVDAASVLTMWKGKLAYLVTLRDMSPQKAAEETLRFQAALVNYVSDAIIATTHTGIVTSWNPAAEAIYRCPAARALALPASEVVGAPLDPAAIVSNGGVLRATHHAADGTVLSVRISAATTDNGYVLVCTDQTALLRAEQHFQTIVDSLVEGVVVLGSNGRIESVNPAALRILGADSSDLVYDPTQRAAKIFITDTEGHVINPNHQALLEFLQTQTARASGTLGVDRLSDGQRIWLSANGQLLNPDNPQCSSIIISFTDITAQHTASQQLSYQATHDTLTGLPNRMQVSQHLEERYTARWGAVFYIDLDSFKEVNDSLGHDTGDILLQTAARRLRAAFRAGDFLGRLGGDEFIAFTQGEITQTQLDQVAKRIHALLAKPLTVDGAELTINASIGITVIDKDDLRAPGQVVRDAEAAMYQAKSVGGNRSCYFTSALSQPNHLPSLSVIT